MSYRGKLEPGFEPKMEYGHNPQLKYEQDPYSTPMQQQMDTVLMVAEKPSIAKTIANSLAGGRYMTRKGIDSSLTL